MTAARPLIIKSYLSSLPRHINGEEKVNALTFFAEGAARCGDDARTTMSQTYESCDVGAIIGNAFGSNPSKTQLAHYKVREMVMKTQTQSGKYWLSVDSTPTSICVIVSMVYFQQLVSIVMIDTQMKTGTTCVVIITWI